jgi:hypothetical protein
MEVIMTEPIDVVDADAGGGGRDDNARDRAILAAVRAALAELADLDIEAKLVAVEAIRARIAQEEASWSVAAGQLQ